tara:strand:- start:228 stop:632 length:405 start_codon:yes stop_codon:yes gene_type:complete
MESLTFEFEGTLIQNPNLDETGRFKVNPVEYYGQAYLDAYANSKYKELEEVLKENKIEVEDTSWHNDTCRSMAINLADGYIAIYTPNSINNNIDNEEVNTYFIQKEIYDLEERQVIGEFNTPTEVLHIILKSLS